VVLLSSLCCLQTRAYTALARVCRAALPVAETNHAARLAKSVATESTNTPSMSARWCTYAMVNYAGLWQQRTRSKSRTMTAYQEPWRPSSTTRASTAAPSGRGVGGPDGGLLDLHDEEN
jgi:TnpA family transposase